MNMRTDFAGGASVHDLFVIGGGINGCGIARDAAGRGYSVYLAEMNDLASGTSSGSTKLIHGGLRYLEHYEFRLVREALKEREVLWGMAPHVIWPLRFVLPHHKGMRPGWLLRLGLFLYDHIGGRKALPATATRDLGFDPLGKVLKPEFSRAFEYSDCWVDDARLVVLNAQDAARLGATIRTRTAVVHARRTGGIWHVDVRDTGTGRTETIAARMVVNATGPWVERVLDEAVEGDKAHNVRLVKGSHIVVRKLHDDPRCFFFQNSDGRIFFAIPYETDFTLIGTTDEDYSGDPAAAAISAEEIDYLLEGANGYFARPLTREDIVWSYSGVRPLYDDGASKAQEATRDYLLKLDTHDGAAMLNVFGGKITTYRRLAEAALSRIEEAIGARTKGRWTAGVPLPGGDFPRDGYETLVARLLADYPFLGGRLGRRLARRYGTMSWTMLEGCTALADLGPDFGGGLHGAEVRYLVGHEWARTGEDVLWRRTKLGLWNEEIDCEALDRYLAEQAAVAVPG